MGCNESFGAGGFDDRPHRGGHQEKETRYKMATRPMTNEEKGHYQQQLKVARENQASLQAYIVRLEQGLNARTMWTYEPGAFKQMCEKVDEIARRDEVRARAWEIEAFGRNLTAEERRGFVQWPERIIDITSPVSQQAIGAEQDCGCAASLCPNPAGKCSTLQRTARPL